MKNVTKILENLTAVLVPAEEGGYVCWFQEFPSAMSQGDTQKEAMANLEDAFALLIETNRQQAENDLQGAAVIYERVPLLAEAIA